MSKRVNVSMPDDVFARMEVARAREPRSAFVARVLDQMLPKSVGPRPPDPPPNPSTRLVPASGVSTPPVPTEPAPETAADPSPEAEYELPKIARRGWAQ